MRIKKGFVMREVCAQKVIVAEGLETIDFGKLISLNDTAAFLWETAQKQGNFTIDSLAQEICKAYDVDLSTAKNDVTEIVEKWKSIEVAE